MHSKFVKMMQGKCQNYFNASDGYRLRYRSRDIDISMSKSLSDRSVKYKTMMMLICIIVYVQKNLIQTKFCTHF